MPPLAKTDDRDSALSLTSFVRGNITVKLSSSLASYDSSCLLHKINSQVFLLALIQTSQTRGQLLLQTVIFLLVK